MKRIFFIIMHLPIVLGAQELPKELLAATHTNESLPAISINFHMNNTNDARDQNKTTVTDTQKNVQSCTHHCHEQKNQHSTLSKIAAWGLASKIMYTGVMLMIPLLTRNPPPNTSSSPFRRE